MEGLWDSAEDWLCPGGARAVRPLDYFRNPFNSFICMRKTRERRNVRRFTRREGNPGVTQRIEISFKSVQTQRSLASTYKNIITWITAARNTSADGRSYELYTSRTKSRGVSLLAETVTVKNLINNNVLLNTISGSYRSNEWPAVGGT